MRGAKGLHNMYGAIQTRCASSRHAWLTSPKPRWVAKVALGTFANTSGGNYFGVNCTTPRRLIWNCSKPGDGGGLKRHSADSGPNPRPERPPPSGPTRGDRSTSDGPSLELTPNTDTRRTCGPPRSSAASTPVLFGGGRAPRGGPAAPWPRSWPPCSPPRPPRPLHGRPFAGHQKRQG